MTIPERKTISTRAGNLSYRESGRGEPLLLLHGLTFASEGWAAQYVGLQDLRVIGWDSPGNGFSDPISSEVPTAKDFADTIAAMLDALKIEKIHLLGHSMAGLMVASFARHHAKRLESVIFSQNPAGGGAQNDATRQRMLADRYKDVEELGPHGLAKKIASGQLGTTHSEDAAGQILVSGSHIRPQGFLQALIMLANSNLFDELPKIDVPVLIVRGDQDKVVPEAVSKKLATTLEKARYSILRGVGHASPLEDPAQYNSNLLRFLHRD